MMITYKTLEDGNISGNGHSSIPKHHRLYAEVIVLQKEGKAEILPYIEFSLLELKTITLEKINRACAAEISGGFISEALGSLHIYSSQLEDQLNISGNVQDAMIGNDCKHYCYAGDGRRALMTHTAAQMIQVGRDLKTHKLKLLQKSGELKAQVEAAAQDKVALDLINW